MGVKIYAASLSHYANGAGLFLENYVLSAANSLILYAPANKVWVTQLQIHIMKGLQLFEGPNLANKHFFSLSNNDFQ